MFHSPLEDEENIIKSQIHLSAEVFVAENRSSLLPGAFIDQCTLQYNPLIPY